MNYPSPWPGGWWRLRDIVDYELATSEALVRFAAREHAAFVSRFVRLGRRAVEAGRTQQPAAYVIAPAQRDAGARAQFANLLIAGGVEIRRARAPFAAGGREYPAGTLVIPLAQPFRAHVKDLVERQVYPARSAYPGGPALPPYDVTGWTLPLQMGVTVDSIGSPVAGDLERVDSVAVAPGHITGAGAVVLLANRSNGEATAVWRALAAGASVAIAPAPSRREAAAGRPARWRSAAGAHAPSSTRRPARSASTASRSRGSRPGPPRRPSRTSRALALYRSWNANMDEGWTRWVLERLGVPYTTVTDSTVRAGALASRFDVVLLPSEPAGGHPRRAARRIGTAPVHRRPRDGGRRRPPRLPRRGRDAHRAGRGGRVRHRRISA